MEVIHNLGNLTIRKNVNENAGFLLTSKKGSCCGFFNEQNSRYFGLFYFDEKSMNMYKFIESIEIANRSKITSLKNGFYFAERKKDNVVESFLMPRYHNSLIYELDSENEIDIMLDCKNSYDNREFGRYYEISEEQGTIIIRFTKKTDGGEDSSDGEKKFVLYLAVKSNNNFYKKNDKWVERHYFYDEERNSLPYKRHVYNALKLKGSKFVFSMSKNKSEAVNECDYIFSNMHEIKNNEKQHFLDLINNGPIKKIMKDKGISDEIKLAYINAINSLNNLVVQNETSNIFAGLPWFFQFWSRDSIISLKSLSKTDYAASKKMLFDYLSKIKKCGRLADAGSNPDSENADAIGWLFLRCNEIIRKINKNKDAINAIKKSVLILKQNKNINSIKIKELLKKYNSIIGKKEDECHKLMYEIEANLEKSLHGLLKFHTKDNFEINNPKETWMDAEFGNDVRDGVRIEIQAFRLNMYKLIFDLTQNQKYRILENLLKNKVKSEFWNGKVLADGVNDFTVRPNIFIAAYAYPGLLTNKEWEICFDNALKALWLDWGGVSTIDKNHPLYTETSTGEDPKSYHRGDSWFWINNLVALTLNRINNKKFSKIIKKIINANTEEILWKGCIGCHAELSDAKQLSSKGCFNQAWSDAMYIEMIDEVFE